MTAQELKSELEQTYTLVCFYDLADVMCNHGKIFKVFKELYQKEYSPDQRLIFYTSQQPSQLILDHLQRAATKTDISNYFITVCTPYDIHEELKTANTKYGNSDVCIHWQVCDLTESNSIDGTNIYPFDTFCTLPFGAMFVSTGNATAPCCKYQGATGLFNNNIDHRVEEIKTDIKHSRRHEKCSVCWNAEDLGQTSLRQHFNNKYLDQCDLEWVDRPGIRDLTISPNNLCNFKCRICIPVSSSKVAVEQLSATSDKQEIHKLKTIISWSREERSITENIVKMSSDLNFLHILGGEPLLWHDLKNLIQTLVHNNTAPHIQLEFNTNGSLFSKDIIDQFSNFKSVEILLSIDDLGERFELQRGGSWHQIYENIKKFIALKSEKINVKIAPTVNVQNILYLDQLFDFCESHQIEIVWWFLESPKELSIDRLTASAKHAVFNKYCNHKDPELRAIAQRVLLTAPESGLPFLNFMQILDQRRQQNSSMILKEIFDVMSC